MKNTGTKQVKAPNYTESQAQRMKAVYDPLATEAVRNAQIDQLAVEFDKPRRSIIAKLGTMKNTEGLPLYVPMLGKVVTSTKRTPSRSEIVRSVETALGMARDSLCSLARSNKGDLEKLLSAVPQPEAEEVKTTEA